ncbi:hypothetical protein HK099_000552 [Clydaea vesicula]|uniref:Glutamyl-tRNA(Gln) amidotransferase subunit A, mitochondrial n=1 Tax=Clydaea vesicula TaxID=447962 RepID=A0AAD5U4E7_9FUNG|nr:hypothetical protein HK099_000552 [Clydaea vesicula]
MPIAVKGNISTVNLPTTCSSNILRDWVSPYDASVVKLLKDAGAIIIGKSNMDEFGMGAYGPTYNPVSFLNNSTNTDSLKNETSNRDLDTPTDDMFVPGGSSGGSAAAVAANFCLSALGSDTGGSVRLPASYCGVYGFKPSYGRFSRYGLVSYASSLDTIGILGNNLENTKTLYDLISSFDPNDATSVDFSSQSCSQERKDLEGITIGIPQEYYVDGLSQEMLECWSNGIKKLENSKAKIVKVSLPNTVNALSSYYCIASAEASSNLARFDGIRFGKRSEQPDLTEKHPLYSHTRTEGFGPEVQKRIMLGTFVLEASSYESYFGKATMIRNMIKEEFRTCFQKADILLTPATIGGAPTVSGIKINSNLEGGVSEYANDVFTVPASLAGLPALVVPFGAKKTTFNNRELQLPLGLQLISEFGNDELCFDVARFFNKTIL